MLSLLLPLLTTPPLHHITSCEIDHLSDASPITNVTDSSTVHSPQVSSLYFARPTPVGGRNIRSIQGAKFIPLKPSTNKYHILHDWQHFFRSFRWMAVLGHPPKRQIKPADGIFITLFHAPIHRRESPHSTYAEVECYIHKCLTEIQNLKFTPLKRSNSVSV